MKQKDFNQNQQVLSVALLVIACYAMALLFPDRFWGLHFPAFLAGGKGWILIAVAALVTIVSQRFIVWKRLEKPLSKTAVSWVWISGIALLSGVVFSQMPIFYDGYGDALTLLPSREVSITALTDLQKEKLLSFDLTNLKLGSGTTHGLVAWMSYSRGITVYEAFKQLGIVCGIGYIFFMLASVFHLAKNRLQRIVFTLMVISSPVLFVFCGHVEMYAPVFFLLALFWYVLIRSLDTPKVWLGILLFLISLLNIKFHITGFLTLFVTIVAVALVVRKNAGKAITWRQLLLYVYLPLSALGVFVYAFVTKSVFGPRKYTEENLTDAIFLPISSSDPAPYDRYNLFSFSHIFDYLNLLFVWSAAALIIVIVVVFIRRKTFDWNQPLVQISALAMLTYLSVFFVLNPLLAMPTDWDLMGIPAVVFTLFAVILVAKSKEADEKQVSFASQLIGPTVGTALIGWSVLFVNADKEALAHRMIAMGKYNYKTYWIGASSPIFTGLNLLEEDAYQSELESVVEELEPYQVKGNDIEYAALVHQLGMTYAGVDNNRSYELLKRAYVADPMLTKNVKALYDLLVAFFIAKEFDEAQDIAEMLVKVGYPSSRKALRVAIHTSLEAGDYAAAEWYCEELLRIIPEDAFIQKVLTLLKTSEDKSAIKTLFRQS